jgi:hypothetical protein
VILPSYRQQHLIQMKRKRIQQVLLAVPIVLTPLQKTSIRQSQSARFCRTFPARETNPQPAAASALSSFTFASVAAKWGSSRPLCTANCSHARSCKSFHPSDTWGALRRRASFSLQQMRALHSSTPYYMKIVLKIRPGKGGKITSLAEASGW